MLDSVPVNPCAAARGILFGLLVSTTFWVAIFATLL
jgi:hypothetical protein